MELRIREKETSATHFWWYLLNLPQRAENSVCWAGEKHEDDHNETKYTYIANERSVSLNELLWIILVAFLDIFNCGNTF